MTEAEEDFKRLLQERGWEVGEVRPYRTGNYIVALSHSEIDTNVSLEVLIGELPSLYGWCYWKALFIEAEAIEEKIWRDLHNTFEANANDGVDFMVLIPSEWFTVKELEKTRLDLFRELRQMEKDRATRLYEEVV